MPRSPFPVNDDLDPIPWKRSGSTRMEIVAKIVSEKGESSGLKRQARAKAYRALEDARRGWRMNGKRGGAYLIT